MEAEYLEPEVGADDAGVGGAVGEDDDEGFGQQRNLGGGCRPRAPPSSVAAASPSCNGR